MTSEGEVTIQRLEIEPDSEQIQTMNGEITQFEVYVTLSVRASSHAAAATIVERRLTA
jgi:hypothetical protein